MERSSQLFDHFRLQKLRKSNNDFNIQITIKNKDDLNNPYIRSVNLTLEMLLKQREFCIEKLNDLTVDSHIVLDNLNYIEKHILKLILFNYEDNVTE